MQKLVMLEISVKTWSYTFRLIYIPEHENYKEMEKKLCLNFKIWTWNVVERQRKAEVRES